MTTGLASKLSALRQSGRPPKRPLVQSNVILSVPLADRKVVRAMTGSRVDRAVPCSRVTVTNYAQESRS